MPLPITRTNFFRHKPFRPRLTKKEPRRARWGCGLPVADVAKGNSTDRAGRRDPRAHKSYSHEKVKPRIGSGGTPPAYWERRHAARVLGAAARRPRIGSGGTPPAYWERRHAARVLGAVARRPRIGSGGTPPAYWERRHAARLEAGDKIFVVEFFDCCYFTKTVSVGY